MREPIFSPVGAGLVPGETAAIQGAHGLPAPPLPASPPSLYAEPRITHVGDIVTVIIAINDKATLGNTSGRSQSTKDGLAIDYGFNNGSAVLVVEPAGQDRRRPLLDLVVSGARQHRPVRADPGVGGGGRHASPAERQSRHLRIAGSAGQL